MALQKNEGNLDELEAVSVKELLGYFGGPRSTRSSKNASRDARLAISTLSAVSRLKATMRVKDATQLDVIKSVSENKAEFKEFAAAQLSHLMPKKLLT